MTNVILLKKTQGSASGRLEAIAATSGHEGRAPSPVTPANLKTKFLNWRLPPHKFALRYAQPLGPGFAQSPICPPFGGHFFLASSNEVEKDLKYIMRKLQNPQNKLRVGMVSLGCPKTLVDSEVLLGKIPAGQFSIAPNIEQSDVVLLNTCSFIEAAQKESIDYIRSLLEMKKKRQIKSVIVLGCMVQKFPEELRKEFKAVDAFVGTGEYDKLAGVLQSVAEGEKVFSMSEPGYLATSGEHRVALTPRHFRYLKISEGCDHICSFCTIPSFRGKHRSRTIEDVVKEAERLVGEGAKEIILTGQDTSFFGSLKT